MKTLDRVRLFLERLVTPTVRRDIQSLRAENAALRAALDDVERHLPRLLSAIAASSGQARLTEGAPTGDA